MGYIRLAMMAGLAIIILGLLSAAAIYRGNAIAARAEAAQARADLATAVSVNKANEATMARLKADKDASDKLAAELAEEIDAANDTTLALTKTLAELRAKNADVDTYLRLPVPADLRKLFDHSKAAGGH